MKKYKKYYNETHDYGGYTVKQNATAKDVCVLKCLIFIVVEILTLINAGTLNDILSSSRNYLEFVSTCETMHALVETAFVKSTIALLRCRQLCMVSLLYNIVLFLLKL